MNDAYEQNLEDKVFGNFTLGMNELKTASLDSLRKEKMNERMKEKLIDFIKLYQFYVS